MTEKADIKYLLEPRTVAVIGASHSPDKIGYKLVENIISTGFAGSVYPINPQGGELLGKKVYSRISEVPDEIDLVCICIPAKIVLPAIKECALKSVKFLAVITSGFSEVGNIEEERKMVELARENGMRILGPNIFGIFSACARLNATFGPRDILPGNVAIITQSGALGIAMIGKTALERIGLSAMVSVGNKADIDESDLLEYLVKDKNTRIIMVYLEGVKDGQRFISALKLTAKKKPVVLIKSGRSKRGALAAASHTGSLAGADDIFDAIIRQCGVLRAENLGCAFNWIRFLAQAPLPQGENTAIITNGGGIGVMATDACEKYKVNLYDDLEGLRETFSKYTPAFGSLKNPVDLTGQAKASDYSSALNSALKNPDIHSTISLYCETAMFDYENLVPMIEQTQKDYLNQKKPLVFAVFGGAKTEQAISSLREKGIPVFPEVYDAVSCLGALYAHSRHLRAEEEFLEPYSIELNRIEQLIDEVRNDRRSFLLAHEAKKLAEIAGIPAPATLVARNLDQAIKFAEQIGYPVVMKIVSRDIIHKSDVGGVALNLLNRSEVIDAYEAILQNCRSIQPDAKIEGVEISEMLQPGVELIIGARKDKIFGPVMAFGSGGKYVEVIKDVSFRALPVGKKEMMAMIEETRAYTLLLGVRGEEKKDLDKVLEVMQRLSELIIRCPEISDIEVNPLVVYEYGKGAKALDIRVLLTNPEGGVK